MLNPSQNPLAAIARPVGWPSPDGIRNRAFFLWRKDDKGNQVSSTSDACERDEQLARVEAALLVAPEALSTRRLAQVAKLADASQARESIERLNAIYDRDGTAFRAERVAAGYRLMARPEYSRWLRRLHRRDSQLGLSPPALETLTIIAYRQPIKRADIEAIRGVQSAEMIKQIMERGLVKIGGEEDTLGRPYLYVTTRLFLETFGLRTLDDLPNAAKLRMPQGEVATGEAKADDEDADSEVTAA